jgi:hypothetical protein
MFHDPITDVRQCDGIAAKQRTVAVTMSCHALDASLRTYAAHPHRRRTIQHPFGHSPMVEPA